MISIEDIINKHFAHDKDNGVAAIFYKDREYRYQYINDNLIAVMKYYLGNHISVKNLIGHTDYDIFPKPSADFFRSFDNEVFDSGKVITKFETFDIAKTKVIHAVATKIPIYSDDDQLMGVLGKTRYLNYFVIHGVPVILSKRELDILVHLVFGLPMKTIASTLNVSMGSVSKYINRLKEKIDCQSQGEIIQLVRKHTLSAYILDYLCKLEEESSYDS